VIIFILIVTGLLQIYNRSNFSSGNIEVIREKEEIALNTFLAEYESGSYSKIVLKDDKSLMGYVLLQETWSTSMMFRKDVEQLYYNVFETQKPLMSSLGDLWISMTGAVLVEVKFTEKSVLEKVFEYVGPVIFFLVILFLFMKFVMPKWGWLPFGNMKVGKQANKTQVKTKFDDIAGMEEVKNELTEVIDYLKDPEKYRKVGARHPKGVLLYGPPGSGKTLLARAVAWESNVAFFSASGSEFMEMLVWMGAAKVRELFNKAKTAGTAIIFIDEIDAIWKKRGIWHTGGHQEQEQTLNQILTEMDGFDRFANIVVIAATNRPDTLDPALLRAGRFDRKIMVSSPTYEERILIFEYYFKDKTIAKDVDVESLAKRTSGLVGADIENIANEAALKTAKEDRQTVWNDDFEYALEKVLMWPEKKVRSMREEERKIIAYHELGHAVTMHLLPNADSVEKISIVRRGQALWATWTIPSEDKYLYSKAKFLDEIVGLLWWRAAEEIFFGKNEITTWAANDFEKATKIVTDMVVKYGMDEDLWLVRYLNKDDGEYIMFKPYSEKTAELIDQKIKKYLLEAYEKAKKIINENKNLLVKMSDVLLEKEYLTKQEFTEMMENIGKAKKLLEEAIEYKKKLAEKVEKAKPKVEPVKDQIKQSGEGSNGLKDMLDKFLK